MNDKKSNASSPQIQARQVKCPQCGTLTEYSASNKFRPFCSHRCRLIDLGAWASESYKVPLQDANIQDFEALSALEDHDEEQKN